MKAVAVLAVGSIRNMSPEERQRRMEERLKNMTPEERQRWEARMRERNAEGGGGRGGSPGGGSRAGSDAGGRGGSNRQADARGGSPQARGGSSASPSNAPQTRTFASGATTIDALFAPLPVREGRETAWLYIDKKLKPVRLRTGISDGTWTEVLNESELPQNTEVVISMTTGLESRTTPGQGGGQNPLMGPQRGGPGGRGPGGGGPGGGGGGGGGRGR